MSRAAVLLVMMVGPWLALHSRHVICVLALVALATCGGSSSSSNSFSTSVPEGTSLGQLSAGQLATLCSDISKFASERARNPSHHQAQCKYAGFRSAALATGGRATTTAELQMGCVAIRDGCLAAPAESILFTCTVAPPVDCTATVGQYETCVNDDDRNFEAAYAAAPECSSITAAGLAADGGTAAGAPAPPGSCATFKSVCAGSGDLPYPGGP